MAQHILPRAPTTEKFRQALVARFGAIPVEVSRVPTKPGEAPGTTVPVSPPYVVLTPLWATLDGPPFGAERHADAAWVYQLDLYAQRGDQLEGMRDRALQVALGTDDAGGYTTDLDTEEAKVTGRELAEDNGVDEAVGSTIPSMFRVRLFATPATQPAGA